MDGAHSNQRTCRISRKAALSTLEKRASAEVIIQSDHPRTDSSCTRELMALFCDFRFYFIVNACFVYKWNLHIHERTLYLVGKYEGERDQQIYAAPWWLYRCIPLTSTMPGGKTGSVAALTATFATAVTLTGGVKKGPTRGSCLSGFACWRTCSGIAIHKLQWTSK